MRDLELSNDKPAEKHVKDLKKYGDPDVFVLLCKASSNEQGFMKSTKICNVKDGCVMQVTTQQRNPDGSYAVAEALSYIPGMCITVDDEPRRLVPIKKINVY